MADTRIGEFVYQAQIGLRYFRPLISEKALERQS